MNNRRINIAIIVSHLDNSKVFEWTAEALKFYSIRQVYIFLNPHTSEIAKWLRDKGFTVYELRYLGKKNILSTVMKCYKILVKENIQVVHCHLFEGSLIGLVAGKLAKVKKRIYTRHYSTYHHEYFPKAVWYDKIINFMATDIIACSQNVKDILIEEKVSERKIHLIYHGFKFSYFNRLSSTDLNEFRDQISISKESKPIVGVIARFTHLKGIQYIIPAFRRLTKKYPNAHLILANAQGDYSKEIRSLLTQLPQESYSLIDFESKLSLLYTLFDLYVHTPINKRCEAFGQTYVEALAAGVPSVFTMSGIASEFIVDRHNALVVDYKSEIDIYSKMIELLQNGDMAKKLSLNGVNDVKQKFDIKESITLLTELYGC